LIAFASGLAGKKPVLAGFIIALPLVSILALLFSYLEFRDMDKINRFATSILVAVPLSLSFFIPFLLNRWLKMGFAFSFVLGVLLLAGAYFVHRSLFKVSGG
jgi:hypothetical protein